MPCIVTSTSAQDYTSFDRYMHPGDNMRHLVILFTSLFVLGANAQVPIPKRPLGFTYGQGKAEAPVQLDAFMGPLCPDSQMAFPTIQNVASFYGPDQMRLRIHLFPLPYHHHAFVAAKGTHIVDKLTSGNMTYSFIGAIYKHLDSLSNEATYMMTEMAVISKFADIAADMGVSKNEYTDMMKDAIMEEDTRVEWKYTCTRGISGTPMFTVNDVIVMAEATWTVSDWRKVIDPLYGIQQNHLPLHRVGADCKMGEKRCEYLPGKVECCTKGEGCIPNVGCRC